MAWLGSGIHRRRRRRHLPPPYPSPIVIRPVENLCSVIFIPLNSISCSLSARLPN